MQRRARGRLLLIVSAAASLAGAGCYEETAPPAATQAPPPQDQTAPAGGGSYGTSNSAHAGAKRAAHNTVDLVDEHQQELEKAMKDE